MSRRSFFAPKRLRAQCLPLSRHYGLQSSPTHMTMNGSTITGQLWPGTTMSFSTTIKAPPKTANVSRMPSPTILGTAVTTRQLPMDPITLESSLERECNRLLLLLRRPSSADTIVADHHARILEVANALLVVSRPTMQLQRCLLEQPPAPHVASLHRCLVQTIRAGALLLRLPPAPRALDTNASNQTMDRNANNADTVTLLDRVMVLARRAHALQLPLHLPLYQQLYECLAQYRMDLPSEDMLEVATWATPLLSSRRSWNAFFAGGLEQLAARPNANYWCDVSHVLRFLQSQQHEEGTMLLSNAPSLVKLIAGVLETELEHDQHLPAAPNFALDEIMQALMPSLRQEMIRDVVPDELRDTLEEMVHEYRATSSSSSSSHSSNARTAHDQDGVQAMVTDLIIDSLDDIDSDMDTEDEAERRDDYCTFVTTHARRQNQPTQQSVCDILTRALPSHKVRMFVAQLVLLRPPPGDAPAPPSPSPPGADITGPPSTKFGNRKWQNRIHHSTFEGEDGQKLHFVAIDMSDNYGDIQRTDRGRNGRIIDDEHGNDSVMYTRDQVANGGDLPDVLAQFESLLRRQGRRRRIKFTTAYEEWLWMRDFADDMLDTDNMMQELLSDDDDDDDDDFSGDDDDDDHRF